LEFRKTGEEEFDLGNDEIYVDNVSARKEVFVYRYVNFTSKRNRKNNKRNVIETKRKRQWETKLNRKIPKRTSLQPKQMKNLKGTERNIEEATCNFEMEQNFFCPY
jgi:hypothetical protein